MARHFETVELIARRLVIILLFMASASAQITLTGSPVNDGMVRFQWTPVTGASYYQIRPSNQFVGGLTMAVPRTEYLMLDLQAETPYSYVIAAYDPTGALIEASGPATFTMPATVLPPNAAVVATDGFNLSHTASNRIANFGTRWAIFGQNPVSGVGTDLMIDGHSFVVSDQIAEYMVFTSATEFSILFRSGISIYLKTYTLNDTLWTVTETGFYSLFDDPAMLPAGLITWPNGGVVALATKGNNSANLAGITVGLAYIQGGNATVQFPISLGRFSYIKNNATMARHPADGSLWVFGKMDGVQGLSAARFLLDSGRFNMTFLDSGFITNLTSDGFSEAQRPDGEDPQIYAMPYQDKIVVAYPSARVNIYQASNPRVKGCAGMLLFVDAAGGKTFSLPLNFDTPDIPHLWGFGFSQDSLGGLWLAYNQVKVTEEQDKTNVAVAWRYADGVWSFQGEVGTTAGVGSAIRALGNGFILDRPNGELHKFTMGIVAPAQPSPEPEPEPRPCRERGRSGKCR